LKWPFLKARPWDHQKHQNELVSSGCHF
jgi:hypothetical protein